MVKKKGGKVGEKSSGATSPEELLKQHPLEK